MKRNAIFRSPLFYVGDKYKLIDEIRAHFPQDIETFVEPFVGGGSVFMNVEARRFVLNDLDAKVIALHEYLSARSKSPESFFSDLFALIGHYGLSCSYREDLVPEHLKAEYPKTYYAKFNKDAFGRLKDDYNDSHSDDALSLYVLLIYGFNRMLRFNGKGEYNLPVGNVDFNKNTYKALADYFRLVRVKDIRWENKDFRNFLEGMPLSKHDFVYLDPPYLITFSEYNKYWNEDTEKALLHILDTLDSQGIRFAISNVTHYKGKVNNLFLHWSGRYHSHPIKSNYISYHDNTVKSFREVLVTNY